MAARNGLAVETFAVFKCGNFMLIVGFGFGFMVLCLSFDSCVLQYDAMDLVFGCDEPAPGCNFSSCMSVEGDGVLSACIAMPVAAKLVEGAELLLSTMSISVD